MTPYEEKTVARAIKILERQATYDPGVKLVEPDSGKRMAFTKLANHPDEQFTVMFLNNRHSLIAHDVMFHGTIDGASVHPRVVVRRALEHNAAAVIFCHNHPSGESTPSQADYRITTRLKEALALVDVRVLDHFIVGRTLGDTYSFAENGNL